MAFATIDVTKGITGTIPVANGGTGLTSGTTGQFLKFTGSTTVASSAVDAGKVLQVQEFHYTSYISRTDSSSFDDGLHVDITPSATDSKVLVLPVAQLTKGGTAEVIYRLFRQTGGTGDSGWSTAATRVGTDIGAWTGSTSQANHVSANVFWLDSPNTTATIRYVFGWTTYENGTACQINNYQAGGSYGSQIIAMEIAA
tara:strand:- start:251 stop:847 length:597 start_codon:yes stop_codon:yes gene_type:complete